jgi:hypothetical protein
VSFKILHNTFSTRLGFDANPAQYINVTHIQILPCTAQCGARKQTSVLRTTLKGSRLCAVYPQTQRQPVRRTMFVAAAQDLHEMQLMCDGQGDVMASILSNTFDTDSKKH